MPLPDIVPLPGIAPGLGVRFGAPLVVPAAPLVVGPVAPPVVGPVAEPPLGPVPPIVPLEPALPIDPPVPPVCAYSGAAIASAPAKLSTNSFSIVDTSLGASSATAISNGAAAFELLTRRSEATSHPKTTANPRVLSKDVLQPGRTLGGDRCS